MRADLHRVINEFLDSLPKWNGAGVPDEFQDRLAVLADTTARSRSYVTRNRGGEVQYKPRPEVGTRLVKELSKLLLSLAIVRGKPCPDEEDFATVRRVAEDCLPANRLAIIQVLKNAPNLLKTADVQTVVDLHHTTVSRTLDDLRLLGVVKRQEFPPVSDSLQYRKFTLGVWLNE